MSRRLGQLKEWGRLGQQRRRGLSIPLPRLAYIGDPGCGNVGDDAMYAALKAALPQFSVTPFGTPKQEQIIAALSLGGPRYFQGALLGGGTLISAYAPWIAQVEAALTLGLPLWAMGTGVGSAGYELAPDVDLSAWQGLLPQFRRVGVRGPRSLATLAALGVAANARVVGDLALCLARPHVTAPADPPCFAVNLALPEMQEYGSGDYAAFRGLEEAAQNLCRSGWRCRPVAMHPNDIPPLRRFLSAVGSPETPYLPENAEALMAYLAPCRMTLAVRLHAAVFSCCAGVPPLMLGYRDKCLDFMESMNLPDWHLPLQAATCVAAEALALSLASQCDTLRSPLLVQSQHWQACLASYFEEIAADLGSPCTSKAGS